MTKNEPSQSADFDGLDLRLEAARRHDLAALNGAVDFDLDPGTDSVAIRGRSIAASLHS